MQHDRNDSFFIKRIWIILLYLIPWFVSAQPRIINGQPVSPPEYEWMAGLSESDDPSDHFCGGTLISPQWVLSAAHCVSDKSASEVKIFFKAYYLTDPMPDYFSEDVSQIIIHPDYDSSTYDSDIALLKLSRPVNDIVPLRIASSTEGYLLQPGKVQTVLGWGTTDPDDFAPSDTLLKAEVPVVSFQICNSSYAYNGALTSNMVCAGYMTGGTDACAGDSGGPLFTEDNQNRPVLTGVVSWGYGCAEENLPGVYTKVQNYYGWIKNITGISSLANNEFEVQSSYYIHNRILYVNDVYNVKSVELYDATGKRIYAVNGFNERNSTLSLEGLQKGLYILQLQQKDKMLFYKFILR